MSADLEPEPDYIVACIHAIEQYESARTMGRPSVFTAKKVRKFLEAIERGNFVEPASHYAGLSYKTVARWLDEGKDDDTESTPQWHFWVATQHASAMDEDAVITRLGKTAEAHPRYYMADVIRLSRRHRNRWSEQTKDAPQINVGIAFGVMGGPGAPPAIIEVSPSSTRTLERKTTESLVISPGSHNADSVNQG